YDLPEGGGRITIGGVNIADIQLEHLRRNIGIVLQEPFLFSRTIEDNIRAGRTDLDLEALRPHARTAAVDEAILSFEKGYQTVVGERGVTLSGGQKQRVAIARTLAQDPRILVFDDSLSAVDTETDARIREALARRSRRATTILISHRAVTLMQADCILVLDQGRVVQMGTHAQLMAEEGIYRRVCEIQTGIEEHVLSDERKEGQA
ncbi:MAG: ATP-binding cassette domain-containing protein, partial [Clostridia bacterium]|nr:ATP-binding cassette domain-containing protein [Clostridia bacterium]